MLVLAGGLSSTAWAVTPMLAAGSRANHVLEVRADGKVYAWGNNNYGQLGDGTTTPRYAPVAITLAAGVTATAVAAGASHSLAIGSDGKVYAWGSNSGGQLGDGTTTQRNTPVAITLAAGVTASAVAAGPSHSLAIGSDGKVYAWGWNNSGRLGDGTTTTRYAPVAITLAAGVTATALAAGSNHSLAIGSNGKVYAWGNNGSGQLGDGTTTTRYAPVAFTLAAGVTASAVAAGEAHSLARGSDGKVYAWGNNGNGQLGDGTTTQRNAPVAITLAMGVTATAVAAGSYHSLARGSDGKVYAWGYNGNGQLGDGTMAHRNAPVAITLAAGVTATAVAAGEAHSLAIGSDGKVYAWGYNGYGQLGDGTTTQRNSPVAITLAAGVTATAVAAGEAHSLARGSDGKVYAWGSNSMGQLGDGTTTQRIAPVAITLAAGVTASAVVVGDVHSLAIGNDGKVYAWGNNGNAQLGDGTTTTRYAPVAITLAAGVTASAVAGGLYHSLAIGSNGKVYAWGYNIYGQLGDGTTFQRYAPMAITLAAGVTASAVAAGEAHSLARGSDGKVYAWGSNSMGQLGDGTTNQRDVPVAITLAAGVTASAVAAGRLQSLAIGSDGKVYAWGNNGNGQLGDGTTTPRYSPVAITLAAGVTATAVAAGDYHSLAIGSDGKVYAWGYNGNGQLGDGTTFQRNAPVEITLAAGVTATAVAAGNAHSMAVGTDGKVYAWGNNINGQLGDSWRASSTGRPDTAYYGAGNPVTTNALATTMTPPTSRAVLAGQSLSFSAAVAPAAASGSVAFIDTTAGTVPCVAATLISGTATCYTALSTLGSHAFKAFYSGDTSYAVSEGSFAIQVNDSATVGLTNLAQTYDGTQKSATCTTTPSVSFELNYNDAGSGTGRVNAGGYGVTCTVTQANYVGSTSGTLVIGQATPTIGFTSPPTSKTVGDVDFPVAATANSGGAISYSSTTTGVCTVSGNSVHLVGSGTCTVRADAAATTNYTAGYTTTDIAVGKQSQTLTFNMLADKTLGAADFTVSATASSGLAASFASQTTGVCTVSGNTVHLVARGSCTLRASQAGNTNYNAAPDVDRSFFVYQNVGLNDTGQTLCYDAAGGTVNCGTNTTYPRQDGRYGRDAANPAKIGAGNASFDYTALDANGNPATPSSGATPHPCVRDNVTGLVWEVKTDDGGLHDKDWTYTWYSSNNSTNGGNPGTASGGSCGGTVAAGCDTEKFVAAVNAAGWCGYSDWRLPTRQELVGLLDSGLATSPRIDIIRFPNTRSTRYWTATPRASFAASAWYVDFDVGYVYNAGKTYDFYVRLVRGGQ